jgi:hypothetical protein
MNGIILNSSYIKQHFVYDYYKLELVMVNYCHVLIV